MKIITLTFLIFSSFLFAQDKYFIYFKDKEIKKDAVLEKSAPIFQTAASQLSDRSIERRKKNMGEENYITYEDLPIKQTYLSEIKSIGIEIIHRLKWFNAVSAYLNEEQRNAVFSFEFVERVEPVKKIKYNRKVSGNELIFPTVQNGFQSANNLDYGPSFLQVNFSGMPMLHDIGITGAGVRIGVLDSGFDWQTHPAFSNANIIDEYDFVFNDNVTSNEAEDSPGQHNHGTNVLSTMAAFEPGVLIGGSYDAEYLLAKTEYIPTETNTEEDNYAAALQWMDSLGVDITTSSVGYSDFDNGERSYSYSEMDGNTTIVSRAENLSFQRGVVSITSAGNEGNKSWKFITAPADAFYILAVGSANTDSALSNFSSRGPTSDGRIKPEVLNLGTEVVAAQPTNGYTVQQGTSFSAPLTASVAGLLLSAHPHLKNTQVRQIILESGDNAANPNNDFGYGIVSAPTAICFPNLSQNGEQFTLYKIFINENGIDPGSVKINYKVNSGELVSSDMDYEGGIRYTFNLAAANNNDSIKFYFSYSDTLGNIVREPEAGYYHNEYGSLLVTLMTKVEEFKSIPDDFTLMQNYPNPFNLSTTFEYVVAVSGVVEIDIYNSLGQRIRRLFKGNAERKMVHKAVWNGRDDKGEIAASGVYFYTLKMGDSFLSNKMVLLK